MHTQTQNLIHEYLAATSEQRMDEAAAYLSDDAILIFPQGRFGDLAAMATAMAGRYRTISKTHDTWDLVDGDGASIVVTTGTLSGINIHGATFTGVRFCDRFVVEDGQITEQHVWNDLAESGVLERTSTS